MMNSLQHVYRFLQEQSSEDSNRLRDNIDRETAEFFAFIAWYACLICCCVIPTCCAYRRRRRLEARLHQQHIDVERLARQNLFFLDPTLENSTAMQERRTEHLNSLLKDTTMNLIEKDFEEFQEESATEDMTDEYDDECNMRVRLPNNGRNAGRSVPGFCAICLSPYAVGDEVTWATRSTCQHAFHSDCIREWLAKKDEQKCPVCRQDYCDSLPRSELHDRSHEELFLDNFAIALNYARSQAMRNWALSAEAAAENVPHISDDEEDASDATDVEDPIRAVEEPDVSLPSHSSETQDSSSFQTASEVIEESETSEESDREETSSDGQLASSLDVPSGDADTYEPH